MYDVADWILVRAPLLPVQKYFALSEPITEKEGKLAESRWVSGDSLVPNDPAVRTALAVGSSDLFRALERCRPDDRDEPRLRGKLLRYLIRMSTRPTPFGLFAGVALARWGEITNFALGSGAARTRTRPDMAWLLDFVFGLEARPEIRTELRFFVNPGVLVAAGRVFLAERASIGGTTGAGPTVSLRATAAVRRALALARKPIPYADLSAELLALPGSTPGKVEKLITELWKQTVLLTDLRPPLTVTSPARHVAQRLVGIPAAKDAVEKLERVLAAMMAWDAFPAEDGVTAYADMVALTNEGHSSPRSEPAVQVDMALTLKRDQINAAVAREVVRAAELLLRLTPLPCGLPHLEAYQRAFESRYGPDREVRLVELLDTDFGLGPPAHLGQSGLSAGIAPDKHALRQETLRDLALDAIRAHRTVVELDAEAIARLESWTPDPATAPLSLDVSVLVAAESAAAIDAGDFQIVIGPNLGANGAGRNLGRFADLLAPEAEQALRRVAHAEAAHTPGRLWAELSYLPHRLRSANVAIRPLVRDHEIVLGATPTLLAQGVIPLDELVVGVRAGRLIVRWPAADAEVTACAGHMLNTIHAPAACRFLDDLRHHRLAQFRSFDWGAAGDFPFLPRVQTGRIVLSVAQWRVDAGTLRPDTPQTFDPALQAWRDRWQVPQRVYLTIGDNRLLLDLKDPAQAEQLRGEIRHIKRGGQLLLSEAIPSPEQAWAEGPSGNYATELVVPLVLRGAPAQRSQYPPYFSAPANTAPPAGSRLRPPGSNWLFVKLYGPRAFQDDLIVGPMAAFCEYVNHCALAENWFFIRYTDPDLHVRLRFRGDPERLTGELLPQVCSWARGLIANGMCTRFCFDTYEREVERYGGPQGTGVAETLFGADSRAVVDLLRLSQDAETGLDRTTLTVLSIDDLLGGLGLVEADRLAWCRDRVVSKRASGPEYRQRQSTLRRLLGDSGELDHESGGAAVASVFAARRRALALVRVRLDALTATGELQQPVRTLCNSFAHMHCNRLASTGWPLEKQALGLLLRAREGLDRAPLRR